MLGASVAADSRVYRTARVWAPWNLKMASGSCIGDCVDCYNVDLIQLGENAVVSQYSFLCTASHDYEDPSFPLMTAPIDIQNRVWVAADVFVGPGVSLAEGTVVLARSTVLHSTKPWGVYGGYTASRLKGRDPTKFVGD